MHEALDKLLKSKFRARFKLKEKDLDYIETKGFTLIKTHAEDFITKRLAPAHIPNDGQQTPYGKHPVFTAQHATATCCRGCLQKWHAIPKNVALSENQKNYVINLIVFWLENQINLNRSASSHLSPE